MLSPSPSLSLHAAVVHVVRIAAVDVDVDEGQQQGRGQVAAVGPATLVTHRIKRGRTSTRRDRGIMTENEDTIERWVKRGGRHSS